MAQQTFKKTIFLCVSETTTQYANLCEYMSTHKLYFCKVGIFKLLHSLFCVYHWSINHRYSIEV